MDPARARFDGPTRLKGLSTGWGRVSREFHGLPFLLARESVAFVMVSVLDVLMTHALLRQGFRFYESNPVARWFFARWNMAGMVGFKFLVISIAVVACEVVERRRPGVGRRIIRLGIVAACAVVAYSVVLFYRHVNP
jgi:hypothetical protein